MLVSAAERYGVSYRALAPSSPLNSAPRSAPLQRVQSQIRHKQGPPYGLPPIYYVLSLSSLLLCAEEVAGFAFDDCSLVPRFQNQKQKSAAWTSIPKKQF